MSLSYRQHPELATPAITRPCSSCGHQVSHYRWEGLGLLTYSHCEETGVRPVKAISAGATRQHTDHEHVCDRQRKRQGGRDMPRGMKTTEGTKAAIATLAAQGKSKTEICKELAISFHVVDDFVREQGVEVVNKRGAHLPGHNGGEPATQPVPPSAAHESRNMIHGSAAPVVDYASVQPQDCRPFKRIDYRTGDELRAAVDAEFTEQAEPAPVKVYKREPAKDVAGATPVAEEAAASVALDSETQNMESLTGYCINHAMPVVEGETCPERADEYCVATCMDWRTDAQVLEAAKAKMLAAVDEELGEREPEHDCRKCVNRDVGTMDEPCESCWGAGENFPLWQPIPSQSEAKEPEDPGMCDVCRFLWACESEDYPCNACRHGGFDGGPNLCEPGPNAKPVADEQQTPYRLQWEMPDLPEPEPVHREQTYIPFGGKPHNILITITAEGIREYVDEALRKVTEELKDPAMAALMRLAESVPMTSDHRDLITIAHELGQARGDRRER